MKKLQRIINIEDTVGKHWDINRALSWNHCPQAELATNAEMGLEMIEDAMRDGKSYDLLITDMHYSVNGRDNVEAGLYVIGELKRRGIDIPIIICSSIRYHIPEIHGCIFYNRSRDLAWDLRELLHELK